MGIENIQQRFCDFRVLIINFVMNPPGEKRESLDQSLNVRVLRLIRLQKEAACDLWLFAGKLCRHLPDETELSFVIREKIV